MGEMTIELLERARIPQTRVSQWSILTLWREGKDTYEIAKILSSGTGDVPESEVANRLAHMLDRSRHG
jgi:hypothetical protein